MAEQLGFSLRFPEGWSEVPSPSAARRRFVFARPDAATGVESVRAVASIEVTPRGGIRPAELLARAQQPVEETSGGYRLWRREADEVELAAMPCVVVHDVFRPPEGGHPALQQRLLVTYFPPAADSAASSAPDAPEGVAVQFTLSSPDLLVFDDFLADGLAIAATLTLSEPEPA